MIAAAILAAAIASSTPPVADSAAGDVAPGATEAPVKGADPALAKDVRVVGERIAAILHLPTPSGPVAVRADEAAREAEARRRADAWLPPAIAAARGRAWSDLGLGSNDQPAELARALALDLAGMTLDVSRSRLLVDPERLVAAGAAGDPAQDEAASLLLATGVAVDEPAAGHYVAHVLTDGSDLAVPVTTDALLARAALSEGTANLAALVLLFGGVGLESEVIGGKIRPDDVIGGRLVPPAVQAADPVVSAFLQFVYLDGFAQSAALARQGDFRRLLGERAKRRSTRDVIHLDRTVAAPPALSEPALPPSLRLRVVDRDSLGEEGIVVLVSHLTGKDNLGMMAGDGWVADGLWRFEPVDAASPAAGLTVWESRWISPEESNDFAYGLERCLQARFPGEALEGAGTGQLVLRRQDRVYRLKSSGGGVRFQVADLETDRLLQEFEKKKAPAPRIPTKKK